MGIIWILIIAAIAFGIYFLVRGRGGSIAGLAGKETPMDVLKKRYASGEITKEEFESIKKDIEKG